jgi:glycosyltransferase involved in cell wall biosynthesis
VPRADVPALLAGATALVNNMRAGAPDKVVYEAAASCVPVLASNPVFDELFAGLELELAFARERPEELAARIEELAAADPETVARVGLTLRERVAERHSVDTWAAGVIAAAGL